MASPVPAAPATRSGETAPLKTYSDELVAAPDWNRAWWTGSISYHRSSLRPPALRTACCVQMATAACDGSTPETACVRRPSSVSRTAAVPDWGALGGQVKPLTGTVVAPLNAGTPPELVTLNSER